MKLILLLLIGISIFGYSISERIGKWWLSESEYKGDYVKQSVISAILILVFVILFFTLAYTMTYDKNCNRHYACSYYDHYMISLDSSWYKFILWPSVIIIFVTEFFIRTIIKRNNAIYPILNTIFLSALPLFIAYLIENIMS